ncbi:MerR family transcriptional regulator [Methylobacterium sp. 391_Methyba4]|uniref:MerR family transcriptional regulator n=1 Tax=Methylobacterium sp. 391_Methyba4 TaxID=3038924 RepID=UPI00241E79D6|nr:MerR family transcriptional regulator [Methylobacterium sp. 391_Methyba4]WFS07655.1 MerR family transcriptional regulator [Methylobacterium sp. 391_Methyba4]
MEPARIESWAFSRSDAAALVGMTSGQIGNYLTRYDLFPERPKGKGYHVDFKLADLLRLCAVKVLIDSHFSPEQAAFAMRTGRGLLSAMRNDGWGDGQEPLHTYPGTVFFGRRGDGTLSRVNGPDVVVGTEVRAWPIFDDLWPRVRSKIRDQGKSDPAPYSGDVEAGIAAFEAEIAALRALRWNEEA